MAINPLKAPLVITQNKTHNVNLNRARVGTRETLNLEMKAQSLADVQWMLRAITIDEVQQQRRLDNEPTRFIVDNREGKPVHLAQRRTEVQFGNTLDQVLLKAIERALLQEISSDVQKVINQVPNLTNLQKAGFRMLSTSGGWNWLKLDRNNKAIPFNPYKAQALNAGESVIMVPRSEYASLMNMFSARVAAGWTGQKLWERGKSGGSGFMRRGIDKIRRGRLLKNYTITAGFTVKHAIAGEIYYGGYKGRRGSPKRTAFIRIKARRVGRYRRRGT